MNLKDLSRRIGVVSLTTMMAFTTIATNYIPVKANEVERQDTSGTMGPVTSNAATSADSKDNAVKNVVEFQMLNGTLRATFLKDNEFRLNFEKTGSEFVENAKPFVNKDYNKVFILDKYASDFEGVEPTIVDNGTTIELKTNKIILSINKDTSLMRLTDINGNIKWEEAEPIKIVEGKTTQTLKTTADEYFYGGGTQNGYFSHKNTKLQIAIGGGWEDGGRSNPVPFYMSTKGYAVMRHTFTPGEYDFSATASFTHNEERFDAFYFVNDGLSEEIDAFTELTGRPVFWPKYGEYIGHADCYNYNANTGERDLNEHGSTVLDNYLTKHNVPLGWMLVNDGYGCHYGKTGTVDGNIENLKKFVDNASSKGVETGLWTQSSLRDESPSILRNIDKEVMTAGTRAIKTDVAWVGSGYDMQMNSVSTGYEGIAQSGDRPFIFSLYGWAGSQRYAGMWTGDQTGGRWEYIRFMIPSYIGSGLSGQPNVGSDIDSIYKGSKTIATRDLQWKAFTPLLYYMGGWDGSSADELDGKTPWEFGAESEAIQQFYLKTRAEMTPYNYTNSYEASKTGNPMLRAMVLEYPNDPFTYGKETQYQYMWGENLLVAPVYEGEGKDTDIGKRNNIYLPDSEQTWIDYFTGEQYQGGQSLYNFDAPLWKLPLLVKSGAILPMTEENNAAKDITDDKDRIFNIYPDGSTDFDLFEDDGMSINSGTATTKIKSEAPEIDANGKAEDGTATITIDKRIENGYDALDKATEFQINTHKEPTAVKLTFNGSEQTLVEVTKEEYQEAIKNGDDSRNIYYYDTEYNLAKYDGSEYINGGNAITAPRLMVHTVKTDVSEIEMVLTVEGFNNSAASEPSTGTVAGIPVFNEIDGDVITPTSITLTWDKVAEDVDGSDVTYDIEMTNKSTGISTVFSNAQSPFLHKDLANKTEFDYKIRSVNKVGKSAWSDVLSVETKEDPFKFSPANISISWDGPSDSYGGKLDDVVDKNMGTQYHSIDGAANTKIMLDMEYAYPIKEFVYVPRQDYGGTGGNGTLQTMDLEVSMDGKTWKKVKDNYRVDASQIQPMYNNVFADVITFDETFARYVRLTVRSSVGNFFTAQELIPVFSEGGKPRTAGTPLEHTNALGDPDLIPMKMYSGTTSEDDLWGQVNGADANYNNISDAYDLVNITSKLDGGIKPSADASIDGIMNIAMNKTGALNAGETVRVDVVANNFVDINALSAELAFDNASFDVVDYATNPFKASANTLGLLNYSRYNPHGQSSAKPTLYVDMANRGEKARLNGNFIVGSFTLKAKANNVTPSIEVKNALVVNSNMVQKDAKVSTPSTDAPEVETKKVERADITSVLFTTPGVTNDDGTQVLQGGKSAIEALFDGNLDSLMEFKWSQSAEQDIVKLPATINFTFKAAKKITELKVYNRVGGNGYITEMEAYGYLGDTKVDLGTFTTNEVGDDGKVNYYSFTTTEGNDFFDRIEVVAKKASNMTTLTWREIEFTESNEVAVSDVTLTPSDEVSLNIGKLHTVRVNVGPENALNKNVTVEIADPTIASATHYVDGEGNELVSIQGLAKGTTTLTVKSVADASKNATLTIHVDDSLEVTDYNKFIASADAKLAMGDYYQEEGRTALQAAVDAAKALDFETCTQAELDDAVTAVVLAMNNLQVRETNNDELLPGSIMTAEALYSESNEASLVLDGETNTFWESPYGGSNVGLPKDLTITLPEVFKLNQIDYVPFQARNGLVTSYEVSTSVDGTIFTKVAEGTINRDKETDYSTVPVKFKTTEAKYIRFTVTGALGREADEDNRYARIAELRVYGKCDATDLELDVETKTLKKDETLQINAKLTPTSATSAITWESSDSTIATVSKTGLVTALKNGKVTITATANELSAEAEITVDALRDITATIADMDEFVTSVGDKPLDDYTETTWNAFSDALTAAKAITAEDTQTAINEAETALKEAKDALILKTSKEKLQEAVASAADYDNTDAKYTVTSFKALTDAITTANEVLAKEDATDTEYGVAKKAIDDAITGLVDIRDLRTAINAVVKPEGDFSTASSEAFDTALTKANAVLAKQDATNDEVKNAVTAVNKINEILVDVAPLRATIEQAKALLEQENLISSYVTALEESIATAEGLLTTALTKEEVENSNTALKTLVTSPQYKGDKTALKAKVEAYEHVESDKDKYTDVSYTNFNNVFEDAKAVLADENATQQDINNILVALEEAYANLQLKPENPEEPGDPSEPELTDKVITSEDGNVTISGKLPEGVKANVKSLTSDEIKAILNGIKDKDVLRKFDFEQILDISLMKDNIAYTAEGKMLVSIKLSDELLQKKLAIVYITDNGEVKIMDSYIENGYIKFEAEHFSKYGIVSYRDDYKVPSTGDNTNNGVFLMLIVCSGYILTKTYKKAKKA